LQAKEEVLKTEARGTWSLVLSGGDRRSRAHLKMGNVNATESFPTRVQIQGSTVVGRALFAYVPVEKMIGGLGLLASLTTGK